MRADSKMTGRPLPGCVPPPTRYNSVKFLEAVLRTQVQHLREAVREVEGRAAIDVQLAFPIRRRHHALETDALLDVGYPEFFELAQRHAAIPRPLLVPVHVRMLMRHRQQHIQRAVAGRRHGGVGAHRVLHIERRVFGQNVLPLDLVKVATIIFRNVNVVMREVVEFPLHAEIQHERRAGKILLRHLRVAPAAAQLVRHERRYRVGKIGVHHHGVGALFALRGAHAHGAAAFKEDFLHRRVELDFHAEFLRHARHVARDGIAAADRMPDAIFVFEK